MPKNCQCHSGWQKKSFFKKKVFFDIRGPTWAFYVFNTFWFEQLLRTRNLGGIAEIAELIWTWLCIHLKFGYWAWVLLPNSHKSSQVKMSSQVKWSSQVKKSLRSREKLVQTKVMRRRKKLLLKNIKVLEKKIQTIEWFAFPFHFLSYLQQKFLSPPEQFGFPRFLSVLLRNNTLSWSDAWVIFECQVKSSKKIKSS